MTIDMERRLILEAKETLDAFEAAELYGCHSSRIYALVEKQGIPTEMRRGRKREIRCWRRADLAVYSKELTAKDKQHDRYNAPETLPEFGEVLLASIQIQIDIAREDATRDVRAQITALQARIDELEDLLRAQEEWNAEMTAANARTAELLSRRANSASKGN